MKQHSIFSKKHSLLAACLLASFGIHLGGLFLFSKYTVNLEPHIQALFGMRSNPSALLLSKQEMEEKLEKEKLLEEVFEELVLSPSLPYDAGNKLLQDVLEEMHATHSMLPPALEVSSTFSLDKDLALEVPTAINMPSVEEESAAITLSQPYDAPIAKAPELRVLSQGLVDEIATEEISTTLNKQEEHALQIATLHIPEIAPLQVEGISAHNPSDLVVPSVAPKSKCVIFKQKPCKLVNVQTEPLEFEPPALKHYNLADHMPGISWSKVFDAEFEIMPDKQENRYIFSMTLTPIKNLSEMRIKQNFYFLLDRSSSIEKHRFTTFKKGTLRALHSLQEGDSFNIVILDQKITRLSDHNLPFTPESLRAAEEFLDTQEHGGFFAVADLYTSLEKVMPTAAVDNEIHTAILISDGNTLLKSQKQQKSINQWMQKNHATCALYTAAVGMDNNLNLLDLLSSLNRGKLLHSDTHAAFPRRLAKQVLDLRNPLAKELMIYVRANDPDVEVHTFPATNRLPYLHDSQPYVILGTMDQLTDLTISLQAKSDEGWIAIDKKFTCENAKKAGPALAKLWAAECAHERYEKFLQEGKTAYLDEAKALLTPK